MLRAYDENAMASTPNPASKAKRAPLSNRPHSSKQPLQKQHLVASELKPRRALGDISNATPLAAPHSQLHHAQHKAVPKPKHGVELFPDDVPPVERFHRVQLAPPPSLDASGIDLDACVAAACGAQGAAAAYASEEPYDQVTIESLLAESLLDEVPLPPHLHPGLVAPDEVQPSGSSPPASLAEPYPHLDMSQFKWEVSNDESEEDTDMELE